MRLALAIAIGLAAALLLGVLFHLVGWNSHQLALIPLSIGALAGYLAWIHGAVWFATRPHAPGAERRIRDLPPPPTTGGTT